MRPSPAREPSTTRPPPSRPAWGEGLTERSFWAVSWRPWGAGGGGFAWRRGWGRGEDVEQPGRDRRPAEKKAGPRQFADGGVSREHTAQRPLHGHDGRPAP